MAGVLQKLRLSLYYARAFKVTVRNRGWYYALLQVKRFLRKRIVNHDFGPKAVATSVFQDIIDSLPNPPLSRPLLLIISDIKIKQCIHYRIRQKEKYLQQIGFQTMHISPAQQGRMHAFLGLAHTVIIYRTVIKPKKIAEFQKAGLRVIFEFDDLIVGEKALKSSGILTQLTERQTNELIRRAGQFLETAQACDEIIVSTPYLAKLYSQPENLLDNKQVHVIPNFVETDTYKRLNEKDITFAYTSPAGSVHDELKMITSFLSDYDATTDNVWNILVMGNDLAYKELNSITFTRGEVLFQPFASFESYLQNVSRAQTVLIPLADNRFNRSKTPIRLMDAAISGTQALFCPVGAYQDIESELVDRSLCVPSDNWGNVGRTITPVLARQVTNLTELQNAVRILYGCEAALKCYHNIFIERMGLQIEAQANREGF